MKQRQTKNKWKTKESFEIFLPQNSEACVTTLEQEQCLVKKHAEMACALVKRITKKHLKRFTH